MRARMVFGMPWQEKPNQLLRMTMQQECVNLLKEPQDLKRLSHPLVICFISLSNRWKESTRQKVPGFKEEGRMTVGSKTADLIQFKLIRTPNLRLLATWK